MDTDILLNINDNLDTFILSSESFYSDLILKLYQIQELLFHTLVLIMVVFILYAIYSVFSHFVRG